MKKRNQFLKSVHFFLAGFILITEGIDELDRHTILGGIMMFLGIILLLYFIYELRKKKQSFRLKIMVHLFEALALLFISYIFFAEGKHYLPYFNLAASIASFMSVVILIIRQKKHAGIPQKD